MKLQAGRVTGEIIEGFAVYTTIDEYGRRGDLVGVFTDETLAERAAKGRGWYAGKGDVDHVFVLRLDEGGLFLLKGGDGIERLNCDLIDERRNRIAAARAKLTDEEAALLGVK